VPLRCREPDGVRPVQVVWVILSGGTIGKDSLGRKRTQRHPCQKRGSKVSSCERRAAELAGKLTSASVGLESANPGRRAVVCSTIATGSLTSRDSKLLQPRECGRSVGHRGVSSNSSGIRMTVLRVRNQSTAHLMSEPGKEFRAKSMIRRGKPLNGSRTVGIFPRVLDPKLIPNAIRHRKIYCLPPDRRDQEK